MGRVLANGSGRPGFNSRSCPTKDFKMVLDTSLFNTQLYKVRIKGKIEQSRERNSALHYTLVLKLLKRESSGLPWQWSPTLINTGSFAKWVECSPMVQETRVQSQRLEKWYLILPCLTLSNIRYVSRVKSRNPGKGVAPSITPQCSSDWKGSLRVDLDYGCQLYFNWYRLISLMGRVFANGPGDQRSIPKTRMIVLDSALLNTQQYKVRIKGKMEQSRERSSALHYTYV